jgi:hypothetical protein
MAVLYKMNPEDPNNPQVLLLGGAGSLSLETLKQRAAQRLLNVSEMIIDGSESVLTWKNALYRVENSIINDLRTIVAANEELETIRSAGGKRSKGIRKA